MALTVRLAVSTARPAKNNGRCTLGCRPGALPTIPRLRVCDDAVVPVDRVTNMFDLVVKGGTVVTGAGTFTVDVAVRGSRIAQLGSGLQGAIELDAAGCIVLPGAIDVHVHLATVPSGSGDSFVDDVATGTRAAAAGGVTTVGHMAFPLSAGESMADATARDLPLLAAGSAVDFFVHPSTESPDRQTLADIENLAANGHRSIKTVTVSADGIGSEMIDAIALAGDLGMVTMIHCEDGPLIDFATRTLFRQQRTAVRHYPDSRPDITELVAVQRVIAVAELTGSPIYLVHLSSARALRAAEEARHRGLPVFVETRPVYLELTRDVFDEPDSGKYVGMPPLRHADDKAALWAGLAGGSIDTVASDHAPWSLAAKIDPGLNVSTVPKGIAELETMLPLLFSSGVGSGRLSLARLAQVTATNPARLFGLYPRKGVIATGSDADLVVLDPGLHRTIDGRSMVSRAGYSVYDGRRTAGWPKYVLSRGEILFDPDGMHTRPGRGRALRQHDRLPPS